MKRSTLQLVAILALMLAPLAIGSGPKAGAASDDDSVVFLPLILRAASIALPPNQAPHIPQAPIPADGETGQSINIDLGWTGGDPDGDAVAYDVYFEAGNSAPDALLCDDVATTACNPGALTNDTVYYWQVVATDEHGATTAGPIWTFTTNAPPDPPSNPVPADGATGQSIDSDLGWAGDDPDDDSITYDVYFEAGNSAPDALLCEDAATTACDPGTLGYDTTYAWQVIVTDEHGAATAGPVWTFTTGPEPNSQPHVPSSPGPPDGATGEPTNVDLGWTGGDPDGDAVTYDVYFEAGNNAPETLLCDDATTTTCDPGPLAEDTVYYWHVIATDEHGATTAGPVWTFTTNAPPHAPSNPSPADGAADQDDEITVSWTGGDPNGDAVTYDVYLEANNGSPNSLTCANVTGTSCDPGPLSWDTHYYWQVVATDEHGATTTGPVWEFWTLAPPQEPTGLTLTFDGYNGPYAIITGAWQDNAHNEAGFEIRYRPRDAGGGDGEVAYVGADETVFTLDTYHLCDTSGSGGYEAEWWIVAYNDAGASPTDYASVTVPECP